MLSLAITQDGHLIAITSSADIYKVKADSGDVIWSRNTADSLYANATDFFISSGITVYKNSIIFSSGSNIFCLNLITGETNWKQEVNSTSTPIISGENVFIVNDLGYFIILDTNTGEIISSSNILKVLKRKKQKTKITNFIMGSDKIYSMTLNGFLIVSSAITGKPEYYKKIGGPNISPLIINDGKLYLLTEKSKILVLN